MNIKEDINRENENFFNVHDNLKNKSLEELQAIAKTDMFPFSICLLNVNSSLNIGISVRSACLSGAESAIIFGRRKFDRRSLVGAQNYIDIQQIDGFEEDGETLSLTKWKKFIEDNNYCPVYCEQGGISLPSFDWYSEVDNCVKDFSNLLLVFGSESTGIPNEFMIQKPIVSIPQRGVLRSFNVSAAVNMFLYDLKMKMEWF